MEKTELQKQVEELEDTPRMGHVPLIPFNSVRGLYELIKKKFKPDFEIAELGSFEGTSTRLFALFVSKVNSIDCYCFHEPEPGTLPEVELENHRKLFINAEKTFLERTHTFTNINKIKKKSTIASEDFDDNSLDAVYIDAEHTYDYFLEDVKHWKGKIKDGGILCGHDFSLPFVREILEKENILNNLETYPDDSWSVIKNVGE